MSTSSRAGTALAGLAARLHRKNRVLIAVIAVSTISTGTLMATAPQHDPSQVEEKAWPVSTIRAEVRDAAPELLLFGRTETPRHATLSAAIAAEVTEVHIAEGQLVEQGQLLLSLDNAEELLLLQQRQADYRERVAQLKALQRQIATDRQVLEHMRELNQLTRARAERQQALNNRQLIATEQLDNTLQDVARQGIELSRQQALVDNHPHRLAQAEAARDRSLALLEKQRLNLARSELRAPFSGRVTAVNTSPGNRVAHGEVLLSLYDTAALQLRVPVPSAEVVQLKAALEAGVAIHASLEGRHRQAVLRQLAGEVGRGKSGIDAIFTLPAESSDLELGRAMEVRIHLPRQAQLIALPLQSIYGNNRIYLVEGERLKGLKIAPLGRRQTTSGDTEVLIAADGIGAGAAILASNLPKASTGLRVAVVNNPAG